MKLGSLVKPVSGEWPCGCDDTVGTVMGFEYSLEGADDAVVTMVKVASPCWWQWFRPAELVEVEA